MSNLIEHAKRELAISDPEGNQAYDGMLSKAVMELIELFSKQGHSGMSASFTTDIFGKLARYQPLSPLTGEDDEWVDVSEMSGKPMWQNKRCSTVFKDEREAYNIDGKVFVEKEGGSYTNKESRVLIEFPYTPTTEYVHVKEAA